PSHATPPSLHYTLSLHDALPISSVVAFTSSGERLVGTVAKRQAVTNPQNTVFSIKRFMGRKEAEVREEESIVPYKVVSGPGGDADRKSTRLNSSHLVISYAVFCL